MNLAVVYYSLEGNTKFVAEKIAKKLNADLIELNPVNAYPTGKVSKFFWGGKSATFKEEPKLKEYNFDLKKYDAVIIGTPIWAGTITPPIRTFLSENDLSKTKVAAFVTCGGGNAKKTFDEIKVKRGQKALLSEMRFVNPLANKDNIDEEIEKFCSFDKQ